MNRSDLVRAMLDFSDLTATEANWLVEAVFDEIAQGLATRGRVELRGFGVFRVNLREQSGFLNPKNGVYYPSRRVRTIKFYPSSLLNLEESS